MTTRPHERAVESGAVITPESAASLPPLTEHARAFVERCERGLDNRADIVGWHGTSLEAMAIAVRGGALLPSLVPHAKAAPGHLFFYPTRENDFEPLPPGGLRGEGRSGAMLYALGNAQYHFLMREAGIDFADTEARLRVYQTYETVEANPRSRHAVKALGELGIEAGRVDGVLAELVQRKGFLVAISKTAVERYAVTDGDVPGEDRKIFLPDGLPFDAIAGIEPLGEVEFAFFEALQRAITPPS